MPQAPHRPPSSLICRHSVQEVSWLYHLSAGTYLRLQQHKCSGHLGLHSCTIHARQHRLVHVRINPWSCFSCMSTILANVSVDIGYVFKRTTVLTQERTCRSKRGSGPGAVHLLKLSHTHTVKGVDWMQVTFVPPIMVRSDNGSSHSFFFINVTVVFATIKVGTRSVNVSEVSPC